jgi:glycosyltransferase involved in cell wall biosynthesis
VIGQVGDEAEEIFRPAAISGAAVLTGRLDHSDAWDRASGCVAGLCLLRPVPAYAEAVATKIWEYMAVGLPPIVSDLPGQRRLVEKIHPDLVCESAEEVAEVVTRLIDDRALRDELAERSRRMYDEAWSAWRPDLAIQDAFAP